MKAVFLNKVAGPEALDYGETPTPRPAAGQVLVEVLATAVMPTELQWEPTWKQRTGQPRPFPVILSHEFSGTVEDLGPEVTDFRSGEEVYGMNDWFENGAQAEYCAAPASLLAPKPKSLDHVQAAVVPISAMTAWQGLFDHARLKAGDRVLIHGAAGGVGAVAVQLAHRHDAYVIGTASRQNLEFVRHLGADEVIDYRATPFETRAKDMDVVFDTVGGETLERSWSVLKSNGRLVTVATQSESSADQRVRDAFFVMEPNRAQLVEIAHLIDAGELGPPKVAAVFLLAQVREAYARAQQGHLHGKIALRVREEPA
ncbi:MAG TPA: NADP-dependent oxidoreductase [Terriglobales bacterium]|nr:NADP-dependent oxidoreductase [Terriglobales bacterium]